MCPAGVDGDMSSDCTGSSAELVALLLEQHRKLNATFSVIKCGIAVLVVAVLVIAAGFVALLRSMRYGPDALTERNASESMARVAVQGLSHFTRAPRVRRTPRARAPRPSTLAPRCAQRCRYAPGRNVQGRYRWITSTHLLDEPYP